MSESCNHNCGSCGDSSCGEHQEGPSYEPLNEFSSVKKVIGVVSGKGGVGKSLVTSLSAIAMARKGYKTAILDADITGPSIPKIFGIHSQATGTEQGMIPKATLANGIKLMSTNLLLEHDTDPLVWRGPVIANAVTQFWHDVLWGEVDYMFIDMPPGTGDVPLTVFQSLPVDGILIVTSPQELVSMIVTKAVKMAEMMNIPVLGLVENMSYFHCPDNGKDYQIFGDSHIDEIAQTYHLDVLAKLPIDPAIAAHCDSGELEQLEFDWMDGVVNKLEQLL